MANRHERVLKPGASPGVRVNVPGGDRADVKRLSQVTECGVAACVSPEKRALELDEEAVATEDPGQTRGAVRVDDRETGPCAAGEAGEPFVMALELDRVEARIQALVRVRRGEKAAKVGVTARSLGEEREVRTVLERHLGPGDRLHAESLGSVREFERAIDAVVVGQSEGRIAELGGADEQLLGQRGAVEERVGTVAMKLDIGHRIGPIHAP